jgi:uncharacterized protein YgbK (DUF1537 family)
MRLLIIADDLTGACDAGALFAGRGAVGVAGGGLAADPGWEVMALDTGTRALEPAAAEARLRDVVHDEQVRLAMGRVFKKIDSTMRGPVAVELDALMSEGGLDAALVCPAFPAQGRTVARGVLRVHGRPVHESAIGRDPHFRGGTSSVVELLAGRRPVVHVNLEELRSVPGVLPATIGGARDCIIAVDAETEADLAAVARAAAAAPRLLVAGSAGLAGALAMALGFGAPPSHLPSGRAWLIVAGSLHPATRAQLEALAAAGVAGAWLGDGEAPDLHPVRRALKDGLPAFLASPSAITAPREEVARRLAQAAAEVLAAGQPDLVAATGGDTARALLRALGARRLELTGAPSSGLALGRLVVNGAATLRLLTKAGGFGRPDLFLGLLK